MKNKTSELQQRIKSLEQELQKTLAAQKAYEADLADKYESGADPTGTLKKISESRDAAAGQVAALRNLDKKLFVLQTDEHHELAAKLEDDEKVLYEDTMRKIVKALSPVQKIIGDVVEADELPQLMKKITETIGEATFRAIDDALSTKWAESVPPLPSMLMDRDNEGQKIQPALHR